MIHRTIPTWQTKSWQEELNDLISCPEQLLQALDLPKSLLPAALKAHALFPVRVTRAYLSRIQKNTPNDPLLQQILPLNAELCPQPGFMEDPLEEHTHNPVPGLIHKYHGRVLLIAAPQCAINCRYCFRRHFDYRANTPSRQTWQQALQYINNNESIEEVILSGGDPLVMNDKQLAWLTKSISDIGHISRLRIHTRLPIVLPSRISDELVQLFQTLRLQVVMVVHCNHHQEIDSEVESALRRLQQAKVTLFNQVVLLKNINDSATILTKLSRQLFSCNVIPYYLHLLDKVSGAAHFEVLEPKARQIHKELQGLLPGYLVPKLVKEVAGETSKTLVF